MKPSSHVPVDADVLADVDVAGANVATLTHRCETVRAASHLCAGRR
jgi:hypothetical protein